MRCRNGAAKSPPLVTIWAFYGRFNSMTLERLLFSQGFGSRRQCRALVLSGAVSIGGHVHDDPSAELPTDGLVFEVHGVVWQYREKVYLALHKPAGHECSHTPQHHPSVYGLLPPQLVERGVQCVGRLDEDTTGLLLLSDDGAFVHRLTSPKRKIPKVYRVTTRHEIDAAQLNALRDGVLLHGETQPSVALSATRRDARLLELTVTEGKYHQVKRMVAAARNRVEALHRHAIGDYVLPDDLVAGQWRWLDESDMAKLAG
jgi:16S rRNA pseudouridine516 synthase